MKACCECNEKFGVRDKLRALNKSQVEIQCSNCKTIYRQREIQSKAIRCFSICIAIFFIVGNKCFFEMCIKNDILRVFTVGGIAVFIIYTFILITQNWLEYERYEKSE